MLLLHFYYGVGLQSIDPVYIPSLLRPETEEGIAILFFASCKSQFILSYTVERLQLVQNVNHVAFGLPAGEMKSGGAIGMVGLSGHARDPFLDNAEVLWSQPSHNHTGFGLLSMHGKEMHYSHVNLNDDSDYEVQPVGNFGGGGDGQRTRSVVIAHAHGAKCNSARCL